MNKEPRIPRLHRLDDAFLSLFVADIVPPGGEGDGDGVGDEGGDGGAEGVGIWVEVRGRGLGEEHCMSRSVLFFAVWDTLLLNTERFVDREGVRYR